MVVTLDGGARKDIHPHSKPMVGKRLSLLARNMVYGESDLVCAGPILKDVQTVDGSVVLTFDHIADGLQLKAKGENTFELSGTDGYYVDANAKLVDGKVVVWAEEINKPTHVRYGWDSWVVPTLYNSVGLPASPFSTHDRQQESVDRFNLEELQVLEPAN